jgi:hypothetical protein
VPVLKLFQFPTIRSLAKFIGELNGANGNGSAQDSFRAKIEERNKRRQGAMTIRRRAVAGVTDAGTGRDEPGYNKVATSA